MSKQSLEAMTVNERLFKFTLMGQFDAAVIARDKKESIGVLLKARFTPEQANEIVSVIFQNPKKYGY